MRGARLSRAAPTCLAPRRSGLRIRCLISPHAEASHGCPAAWAAISASYVVGRARRKAEPRQVGELVGGGEDDAGLLTDG